MAGGPIQFPACDPIDLKYVTQPRIFHVLCMIQLTDIGYRLERLSPPNRKQRTIRRRLNGNNRAANILKSINYGNHI